MPSYIPTIGLEIHAELATKSKMFCSCTNDPFEAHPNIHICPICMGHPGTLPVPNEEAIQKLLKIGLALSCEISEYSKFDRKHYFYPDLPKGYQISQYDLPFCKNGYLEIAGRTLRITRVHLEEDTGSLIHPEGTDYSLVNYNRAGVPLMELVTEPDITSGQEAKAFAQELQLILRYLKASLADMEKGQMRVEANISVRPDTTEQLGTKVEVKNLNSFRSVERAIAFEIDRQTNLLKAGGTIVQETRGWNENTGETFSQREKEEAHDYRYFPEPDIPPITFTKEYIQQLSHLVPELPSQRRARFQREYELSARESELFTVYKELGEYFESVISELGKNIERKRLQSLIILSSNYILSDLVGILRDTSVTGENFLITPENFAELMVKVEQGVVSSAGAKTILKEMFATGADPDHIIEEKGLTQVSDETHLKEIAQQILNENPKAVEDYAKGKQTALQFLVGKMMQATKGAANPELAREVLRQLL